jgi:hypothetical protein
MKTKIAFVVLLLVFPILVFAQKVNTDYDKSYDFSKIKTYAWKEGKPAGNPLMAQRIVNAIDYHLSMNGYQKVDSNPDMFVSYYASTKEEVEIREWGYGRWGMNRSVDVYKVLVGTVIVDLIDAAENKLFWRGVASDTVSDKPEKNEKKINKAAEKMFKEFPPQK